MRYHPHSEQDVARLLAAVGKPSLDSLFESIPAPLKLQRPLELPAPLDERALFELFYEIGAQNRVTPVPFLGAGAYPHHVPSAVDQILMRSEFYTAYTPYQPELAQGTLQAIFEFQTFVSLLTGLPVANASMYDGATSAAEAALMALRIKKERRQILVSRALHPAYRAVLATYLTAAGVEIVEIPYDRKTGATDLAALKKSASGDLAFALVQSPNFFGVIEDVQAMADAVHAAGGLLGVATTEAVSFGLLASPGSQGADIAVGELQSFGNSLSYGGPGLGFFAGKEEFLRQFPGRLAGETVDLEGKRAFVLTLSTREQHIRRENATSNICTNHGLCALAATVHLALLGKPGLRELALLNYRRARHARERLGRVRFSGPTFNEFAVEGGAQAATDSGLITGLPLGPYYPELEGQQLVCVTELHPPQAIEALVQALRGAK